MEGEKQAIQDDREKLLMHKKVLVDEIFKLRNQVASMDQHASNYKEALR